MEDIIKSLWQASETRNSCRISLKGEPFPRVINPYGVCKTSANKIVLVCQHSGGYTKGGGGAGHRNLMLEKILEVELLEEFSTHPTISTLKMRSTRSGFTIFE